MNGPDCSREALRERLGPELFEAAEAQGQGAPDPSPELLDRLRLIFGPAFERRRDRLRVQSADRARAA